MNREERNSLIGTMTTLCYLEKDDSYLMLHRVKKKNDVNQDKWIGVGGHALAYESPEDCLLRGSKGRNRSDTDLLSVSRNRNVCVKGCGNAVHVPVYSRWLGGDPGL